MRSLFSKLFLILASACPAAPQQASEPPAPPPVPMSQRGGDAKADEPSPPLLYIRQYRILGAKALPRIDVEKAVYPYMGPACTEAHVEQARAALEKAYHATGRQTVSVSVPPQEVRFGVVKLQVTEGRVGRLRVRGSRYYDLDRIKAQTPSLAEGTLPVFEDVQRDILRLNRTAGLQVSPEIKPGVEPGTFDVDLKVKDKNPLRASLELNNRYSAGTTPLRANLSVSYANLWQAGHTLGLSAQTAPENTDDAKVLSGYYMFPLGERTNIMLMGTKQDSNVNTLGGAAVAGRGYVLGARAMVTLPQRTGFFHSLTAGLDFKHFDEELTVGATLRSTPIEYYPLSLAYAGTWLNKKGSTDLNTSINYAFRGMGSDIFEYDSKRYKAHGGWLYLRGDLSHLRDVASDWQIFGKVQGQASSDPLINSEQYAAGGLGTVRGYLESEALGDNAIAGSVEIRTPNLLRKRGAPDKAAALESETSTTPDTEWRFHLFADAALLKNYEALPEQEDEFSLMSIGAGTRFKLNKWLTGSVDAAVPLRTQGTTEEGETRVTFRLSAEF
jgi:hemolysin activation/secretion protein